MILEVTLEPLSTYVEYDCEWTCHESNTGFLGFWLLQFIVYFYANEVFYH